EGFPGFGRPTIGIRSLAPVVPAWWSPDRHATRPPAVTPTSPGAVVVDALGYAVLAVTVAFGLWVILHALHFPPVVKTTARLRARQTRRNRRAAEALGLRYVGDDDAGMVDLPLSLMSRGRGRSVHQVATGSYRGRDVRMFRLFYRVPG